MENEEYLYCIKSVTTHFSSITNRRKYKVAFIFDLEPSSQKVCIFNDYGAPFYHYKSNFATLSEYRDIKMNSLL